MNAKKLCFILTLMALALTPMGAHAEGPYVEAPGQHDGYLFDVEEERRLRIVEMAFVEKPADQGVPLSQLIFDDRLTSEFKSQYEIRFGKTEAELNAKINNQFDTELNYRTGQAESFDEQRARQQLFGEYMGRRLVEHHVDKYVQQSPTARPIYELKEKVSNIKLEVKKGYNVKLNYSYSGNYMNIAIDNPYDINNRIILQMDPSSIGPSEIQETYFGFDYNLPKAIVLSTDYKITAKEFIVSGRKSMGYGLSASLTGTSNKNNPDVAQDNKILVGLSWYD